MKIGLQIRSFDWPDGPAGIGPRLAQIGQTADEAGFASIWVMDHYFQMEMIGGPDLPMLEAYSTLSYLAGLTKQVRLGTMVTGVIYRHPGFLVKTVTNLDVLSGGRAYLGIGAAWYEREALGLGFPFPPRKERFERLEETLQIAQHMWGGDVTPYHGKHFQLAEPLTNPQPVRKPHPPILVGGGGEKKTLRFVAKYADACNLFIHRGIDEVGHKLDVLKRHCDDIGRPYDEIECTSLGTAYLAPGKMTPADVIDTCRALAKVGVHHAIFNMPNVHELTPLGVFGREIIPAVAEF